MKSLELSIFIFKILCGIAAVVMIGYWIFKFNKNDDVSAIEYISYETHSDIVYPELSICFISPFTSPVLFWSSSGNISATEYEEYRIVHFDFQNFLWHRRRGYDRILDI